MKIVIYGSRRQEPNIDNIKRLIHSLVIDGVDVLMHEKLYDHLFSTLALTLSGVRRCFECPDDADLAISLGGDGTFLRTVAWIGRRVIPVLGINTGNLGYLTALTLGDAVNNVDKIERLDFRRESLSLLEVSFPGKTSPLMALNEIVVAKEDSASMISAMVDINGVRLAEYKADGVIVSTPTGSTAYNLSVGGPIVEPDAPVWVISPIAAHSLTLRPLVVADSSRLHVLVTGRGSCFRLVIDGKAVSLPMGSEVSVCRADHRVVVLQPHERNFAAIIGAKLHFND